MNQTAAPDEHIISDVLKGNHNAFRSLIERYTPMVHAIGLARTPIPTDIDDIAQDTFIKAYKSLRKLRDPRNFKAWLATIARNTATTHQTKTIRQEVIKRESTQEESIIPDVMRTELFERLHNYIDELPEDKRETILLYYFAGQKLREIADTTGATTNAIEKRLVRARADLGDKILNEFSDQVSSKPDEKKVDKLMSAVLLAGAPSPAGLSGMTMGTSALAKIAAGILIAAAAGFTLWQYMPEPSLNPAETVPVAQETPANTITQLAEISNTPLEQSETEEIQPNDALSDITSPSTQTVTATSEPTGIYGKVFDNGTDAGLPNIKVNAMPKGEKTPVATVQTDGQGNYAFTNLTDGTYDIRRGDHVDYQGDHWTPDIRTVNFKEGASAGPIDFALKLGAVISGTVADDRGNPISNATIHLVGGTSVYMTERTRSDQNGHFRFPGIIPTNDLWLHARKDGYAHRPRGPIQLKIEGLNELDVKMGFASPITGILVDGQGLPLGGYQLRLDPDFNSRTGGLGAKTNADGSFSIANAYPAAFEVRVHPPKAGQVNRRVVDELVVESGQAYNGLKFVYDFKTNLTISGRVLDTRGEPMPNQTIFYNPVGGGSASHRATSDSKGNYIIKKLSEGRYNLRISYTRRNMMFPIVELDGIPAGSENVDLTAHRLTTVSGRLIDEETQAPITKFSIGKLLYVRDHIASRNLERLESITNESGKFTMEDMSPGETKLAIRAEGYAMLTSTIHVEDGIPIQDLELTMKKDSGINGFVGAQDETPIAGAKVFLGPIMSHQHNRSTPEAITDADGRYHLDSVPEGTLMVTVLHPDYAFAAQMTQTPSESDLNFRLTEGNTVHGEIYLDGVLYDGLIEASFAFDDKHFDERLRIQELDSPGTFHLDRIPDLDGELRVGIVPENNQPLQMIQHTLNNFNEVFVAEFHSGTSQVSGSLQHNSTPIHRGAIYIHLPQSPYQSHSLMYRISEEAFDLSGAPSGTVRIEADVRNVEGTRLQGTLEIELKEGTNPNINIPLTSTP
jgi:RNA polymerase sigma-70 factor (ECF subfamily)